MRSFNHKTSGCFLIIMIVFFLIGCAGEALKIDLPANHPANPQAPESAFVAPPNPFQESIPMAAQEADSGSSMTHEEQPSMQQPHMMHSMDQMQQDSRSSRDAEGENQHKEHSQ
jgi:hypothetical protein